MRGKTDRVSIVIGDADEAERHIRDIAARYSIDPFDTKAWYADEIEVQDFLRELEFLPVFSEKVLAVLRNIQYVSRRGWESLAAYIGKPHDHVCLVLSGTELRDVPESHRRTVSACVIRLKRETTPEQELFGQISRLGGQRRPELFRILRGYLAVRERGAPLVVAATVGHLRSRAIAEGRPTADMALRFMRLHELDARSKTGRVPSDGGLELLVCQVLDCGA